MSNLTLPMHIQFAGLFRLRVRRPDGSVRVDTGWFKNLITNQGLDFFGTTSGYLAACQVGTGNTAPANTDTGLASYLAGTTTIHTTTLANQASAPYYSARTNTYRFAAGVATGNISEVGIGTTSTTGNLFSRALVLDGGGSPTTITVLADEVLDVTYQLRLYPPSADVVVAVTDSGPGGVEYTFTTRACLVTSTNQFGDGWAQPQTGRRLLDNPSARAYDGVIADVTGQPSGAVDSINTSTAAAYSAGSYESSVTHLFGLDDANFAGGIDAFRFTHGSGAAGNWQAGVSPAIPKTASETLSITTKVTWSRATI